MQKKNHKIPKCEVKNSFYLFHKLPTLLARKKLYPCCHPLILAYSRCGPLLHGTRLRTHLCQQQRLVLLQVPERLYLECGQENMFPET